MDHRLHAADALLGRTRSCRRLSPLTVVCLVLAIVIMASLSSPVLAGWREEIGLSRLQARLGESMPTGESIGVSQVEMSVDDGDYIPYRSNAYFAGRSINFRRVSGGFSSNSTVVGQHYFGGGSSPACGIRSANIYEANAWVNQILRVSSNAEPVFETDRVQNHSWVGTLGSVAMDTDALRRVDYMVQRDGVLVAAGLNNGSDTAVPRLVCSAYNVVSVGLTNANASRGATTIDGGGRVKPDLVAPLSATSWATPVVAASGALLLEGCDAMKALAALPGLQQRPARTLLVKALLMGGATKDEWPDWRKGFACPCTDGSVPLDYRYGAGELNIDNSYRILAAGECNASESGTVPLTGWDYEALPAGGSRRYYFEIPRGCQARQISILAVWNRRVEVASSLPLRFSSVLPNIDLRLYAVNGSTRQALVDASISRVDNVEHIYLRGLAPGRYELEVLTDRASEYCLTWGTDLVSGLRVRDDRVEKTVAAASMSPVEAQADGG